MKATQKDTTVKITIPKEFLQLGKDLLRSSAIPNKQKPKDSLITEDILELGNLIIAELSKYIEIEPPSHEKP